MTDGLPQNTLDIRHELCPMTFVRTKLRLESLHEGETLVILLRGEEPARSVPENLRLEGHEILDVERKEPNEWTIRVRKRTL